MSTQHTAARYPHVTLSRDASILACEYRGESHESLACHAANLKVTLGLITDERDDLLAALRGTLGWLERYAGDENDTSGELWRQIEAARAAIAKAEGPAAPPPARLAKALAVKVEGQS